MLRVRHGVAAVPNDPAGAPVTGSAADPAAAHVRQARALVAALRDPRREYALSHGSAVAVHGLPYPGLVRPDSWPVELTRSRTRGGPTGDWRAHCAPLPAEHRTVVDGLDVTTLARTAVDVAAAHPLVASLPVVDAAVRRLVLLAADSSEEPWRTTRDVAVDVQLASAARALLIDTLERSGRRRGHRRARVAIGAAEPGAENGFESASRARFLLAGLPVPRAGFPVRGDDGRWYWADVAWPELRVLGEADGRGKYTDPAVLYAEKRRQETLERAGWIVVRWTWEELVHTPEVVVARVARALARAARRASGLG